MKLLGSFLTFGEVWQRFHLQHRNILQQSVTWDYRPLYP